MKHEGEKSMNEWISAQPRRLLRLPAVCKKVGLSPTSVWRGVREERFPAPVSIGLQAVAWHESEIDDWIASRPPAASRGRVAALVKAAAR